MNWKTTILFLLFAHPFFASAQENLKGVWKGTLTMPGGCFPVNNIEIQIDPEKGVITGNSYHYLDINNYVKKKYDGFYDPASNKLTVQETFVTTFNIPQHCIVCIKTYELTYSKNNNVETLSGGWTGHIMNSTDPCAPGTIVLSRVKESAFKEVPEIEVDTGSLRLDFYDNGYVDGDSISVRVNKKQLLTHQVLTAKPITLFVRIDEDNPFQEVEMVAENLGSIPPNTALLIVTAGEKRYQLFLTSTEVKSARVRFVYKGNGSAAVP